MPRISFSSLRTRLLLLVLLAIIPALAFVLRSGFEQRKFAEEQANENALRVARLAAGSQERFIEGARQLLLILSRLPEVQAGRPESCDKILADLLNVYPLYANLGVVDENGYVLCSALPIQRPIYLGDRPWFQRARTKRGFSIGDYQISRTAKRPTLNFAQPLIAADGRFHGEVFAALDLKWVNQIAAEAQLKPGSSVSIIDMHGVVMARNPSPELWVGKSVADLPMFRAIASTRSETTNRSVGMDGVRRLYASVPMKGDGGAICAYVSVGFPASAAFAAADSLLIRNLILLGIAAGIALFVAWFFGNRLILRQVNALVSATKQIASGDLSVRMNAPDDGGELNQLSRSLDEMAGSLQRRIAERREAVEASRSSEEKFRTLFESSPDAIFVEDPDGNVLDVNPSACRLHGAGREDLVGKNVIDLIPEAERDKVRRDFRKWTTGDLQSLEGISRSLDGREIPVEILASRIDFGGRPALLFHVRDITARRQAELDLKRAHDELELRVKQRTEELALVNKALREGQERFEIVMQGTNEGIWDWDVRTNEVYFSRRWKAMLGYGYDEIENRFEAWEKLLHPDDRERALATVRDYLEGRSQTYSLEHRLLHKDGKYRWILARGVALRDGTGKPYRMAGSHFDLTERREAEEELRQLHSFLDSIIENLPNMIFVKDAMELRFVRINKAGEELVGQKRQDLIGKNDGDFFPPQEAEFFTAKDRAVLESGKLLDIPEEPIHTAAGVRILHTKKIPILDAKKSPVYLLGISEDITERKRAEEILARTAAELRRSNLELEQFAYVASHDLQEPLRMVASYTQLLDKRYGDRLDDTAREFIHYAVDGAHRMQVLISDLLAYSRVSTRPESFGKVDCSKVFAEALENLKFAIDESGAEIMHDPLPVLSGDRMQLVQLFQNLIGNALKFCGEKKPAVHVAAERKGGAWRFSVKDNGIGIEPQYYDRIFQIFQRLHSRGKYPGTGIGLALCKRIVERHGGKIWLESKQGAGTTFFFTVLDRKEKHDSAE